MTRADVSVYSRKLRPIDPRSSPSALLIRSAAARFLSLAPFAFPGYLKSVREKTEGGNVRSFAVKCLKDPIDGRARKAKDANILYVGR